ncbi:MAG: type II toxin-antitoxin system RelE/ParE family toxin [Pirellulales bacterium]|nr:type II toxin-antitoxin system RelE/ParE family toxin [Pirellulales bacterium]
MSRLTLAPGVRADLRNIWRHIAVANHNPAAADREIDRITDVFGVLARERFLGESREDLAPRVRCFVVGSYLVLYTPEQHGVRIIQVVHSARDIYTAFRRHRVK